MMIPDDGNASDNPQQPNQSTSDVPSVHLGPVETSLAGAPKSATPPINPNQVDYGAISVVAEDLSADRLLLVAPKTKYKESLVPTLGGIPLLGKVGQGGMGAVYRGIHPRLNKQVAVKVLPLHLVEQQPNLVQRFIREAQIAAQVISPHLVNVSDVNQESGLFYLIMEFVDGVSAGAYLKTRITDNLGPFEETSALDTCIAATTGLNAAHAEGIIHRDIKPDNILIPRAKAQSPGDTNILAPLQFKAAKLADLGLARTETVNNELTGTQATMGTPGYIAPEQALNTKKAAKPADVFSMGATLYGLLAGHAPFVGETPMEAILAAMQRPHTPLKVYRPDVGDATAAVIERCLAKSTSDRYADAAELLEALQQARTQARERPNSSDQRTVMLQRPQVPGSSAMATVALGKEDDSDFLMKIQEAENLLTAQLYPEAIEAFKYIKTSYPKSRHISRADDGLRAAEKAIADEQYAELISQANVQLGAKDYDGAEKAFISAIAKRPNDADAQKGLKDARAGKQDAQYQAAVTELQTLLASEIRDTQYWYVKTARRSKVDEAIASALRLRPNDIVVKGIRDQIGPPPDIRIDLGSGIKLDLVLVKAGEFKMGSDEEKPIHRVKISQSFYISKFMVTVGQFRRFTEASNYKSDAEKDVMSTSVRRLNWKAPGFEQKDDHPVVVVTWNDAQAFAAWFTKMTGQPARLPTEAEWEYAARGPNSNVYPFGNNWDGKEINHADASLRKSGKGAADIVYSRDNDGFPFTSPVGALQNPCWCGAFDMSGNAWEWCQDYYDSGYYKVSPEVDPPGPTSGIYRILRGGAWNVTPDNCKLWKRLGSTPAYRDPSYGFRIVVGIPKPQPKA